MRADLGEARRRVERCLELLHEGRLREQDLQGILVALEAAPPSVQDLLYLQAASTSPFAEITGMLLVVGGKKVELPRAAEQWPYRTVMDALRDGWRILTFPNLALLLDDSRNHGLGPEFILER